MALFNHAERQTGQEAIVKIGTSGDEIRVTNVTWDRSVNQDSVQQNNSLWPTNVTTGLRVSGSLEYEGASEEFRSLMWYTPSDDAVQNGFREAGEPVRHTMTVKEEAGEEAAPGMPRTHTFLNMTVTSESPDHPSDGVRSTSWDWTAEKVEDPKP